MSNDPAAMHRRHFLRGLGLSLLSLIASACGLQLSTAPTSTPAASPTVANAPIPGPTSTPLPIPTVVPTAPAPAATATATRRAQRALLHSENRPGFYIRWIQPFRAPDVQAWRLEIKGLVEHSVTLGLKDIEERMPLVVQSSRMKCVECWSVRRKWGGFRYQSLAQLVEPSPSATHVRFDCVDGYWEHLAIADLVNPRALFTYRMDGEPLPAEYGAPLRMILPWLYGYKGAKAISSLTFTDETGRGYFSTRSSYAVEGIIRPGFDYALDLDGEAREIAGGEIVDY